MSTHESAPQPKSPEIDQTMLLQAALVQLEQLTARVAALEASTPPATPAAAAPTQALHTSTPARGRDPYLHRQTGWQPTRR